MTAECVQEQRVLGPRLQISISGERYNELAHSREVLSEALSLEQRFKLPLDNFIP
jgi:hypothetical protein